MKSRGVLIVSLSIFTFCLIGFTGVYNAVGNHIFNIEETDFFDLPENVEYEPNEILVGYKSDHLTNWNLIRDIKARFQIEVKDRYDRRKIERLVFPQGRDMQRIISAFEKANVRFAEPNYIYRTFATKPNDPLYRRQWGLNAINAPAAWDKVTGGDIVVAIVDQASDWTHEDLIDNLWVNSAEDLNNNGILDNDDLNGKDDDRNGYVDDVLGYNFANNSPIVYDGMGDFHGTHVSGIIGASGNNRTGISGVMWNVKIMRAPFIGGMAGNTYAAIESIDYAIDNNADVINNSWGGKGYSQALKEAVRRSTLAGIVFVAAAGNDGKNNDRKPVYPAAFEYDNIITVAATTSRGLLAKFSNFGANSVHVAAPGSKIYSTFLRDSYMYLSGTSMAAPMVSGMVGLMLARDPKLTPTQIRRIMMDTCDSNVSLSSKVGCAGEVNLQRAIDCVDRGGICK